MMKSWADHCSSDEESLIDEIQDELEKQDLNDAPPPAQEESEAMEPSAEEAGGDEESAAPPERVYDFPTRPPFTAFVGNLAYSVKDPEQLQEELMNAAAERLGEGAINVIGGRIATDRNGRHRGFGYVELETLDQLKLLMTINDGQSMIAGRKFQMDTANERNNNNRNNNNNRRGSRNNNNNNRPSFENRQGGFQVDGSKFRGGRYNGNDDNNRQSNNNEGAAPTGERPSLKLAPRSKPKDGEGSGSKTDIFGGAKAWDGQTWEKKKLEEKDDQKQERRRSSQNKGGRGGRGGRGNRGKNDGGRGGKGDNRNKKNQNNNRRNQQQETPEEKAAKAAAKTEPAPAKSAPAPKKVANSFALLMDSDSD